MDTPDDPLTCIYNNNDIVSMDTRKLIHIDRKANKNNVPVEFIENKTATILVQLVEFIQFVVGKNKM